MPYFLAKTDPDTYSIDDLERDHRTAWDGVANAQAVRAIRSMRPGDRVFIYHSGGVSSIVGMATVRSEPRDDLATVRKRAMPIVIGLLPGVLIGSYVLSSANPGILKFCTYVVLLPIILMQAAGYRRPIRSESAAGVPLGVGVGVLYSTTTISGPPLALMFNNQGLDKEEFRAALGTVRVVETTLTAIAYGFLGLFSSASLHLAAPIAPAVLLGLPLGWYLIRFMRGETFRRVCMSFDAWIVGFGLARSIIDLKLLSSSGAYGVWAAIIAFDLILLYQYFAGGRIRERHERRAGYSAEAAAGR